MWSRVSKLFSKRQGTQPEQDAGARVQPSASAAIAANQSDEQNRFRDAPPTFSSDSSRQPQDSVSTTPAPPFEVLSRIDNQISTSPVAEAKDPWLAARRRPLVYAHKLRLDSVDQQDPIRLSQQFTEPQDVASTGAPGENNTREFDAYVEEAPNPERLIPTLDRTLAAQAPDGERFAMLRAVVKQWRPTLVRCRYLVMIGSTAEARKLAPVVRRLHFEQSSLLGIRICVAGTNTQRIREALTLLQVPVDVELSFAGQHANIDELRTGMITGFGKLIVELNPEWVVVQGDDITAAMASMAAYYAQVPVAHVDGGTAADHFANGDETDPAVLHRKISSLFASVHFADTALGKEHLIREGVPEQYVVVTGSTGVDAMQETCAAIGIVAGAASSRSSGVVHVLLVIETPAVVAHGLQALCEAVRHLATSVPGLYQFVWPVAGDAQSTEFVHDSLDRVPGVLLSGPANYEQYLRMLSECDLVLTDVEDVQEEAPTLGKPVLLIQTGTSRPEAKHAGITTLTESDAASLQASIRTLARKLSVRHGSITNPYGDGKAASRILDFFEGRQVLEFGRTALPRLLRPSEPSSTLLLTSST